MSEKTEQPSPRKLQEARRKGQLPRSPAFAAAAAFAAVLAAVGWSAPSGVRRLQALTAHAFSGGWTAEEAIFEAGRAALALAAPALGASIATALATGVLAAGLRVELSHLAPTAERLDPFAGLRRLLAPRRLADLLKGGALAAGLLFTGLLTLRAALPGLLSSPRLEWGGAARGLGAALEQLLVRLATLALLLGAADFLLARRRHRRELMMTREEAKREHRESEGDPRLKGRRRAIHRQLAAGGPARGVKRATAVVVNPTHLAVALRYDPAECEAPYVVARGREGDALRLKREAQERGIPVVRDVPLARGLIQYDVGEPIPEELYQAAAAVVRAALAGRGEPR